MKEPLMCLADAALLHLRVSVPLVVDLVQDDHPIGGRRLLPCDVHRIFRHVVLDGPRNVISLVCGKTRNRSGKRRFFFENSVCGVETVGCGRALTGRLSGSMYFHLISMSSLKKIKQNKSKEIK